MPAHTPPTPTPAARRRPPPRALLAACGFAASILLPACSNPLASRESDYGERVPVERVRRVGSASMERFASTEPPPQLPVPTDRAIAAIEEVRRRYADAESVELSLEQCRASALEHNLDLRVALVDPTIAATRLSEEEAAFEATFTTRALWSQTDSPTSSTLNDAQAEFGTLEPAVTIPLRTGGSASISLPMTRNETNNAFATLNPSYTSDLELSISHDLLRNAGRRVNTASIRIASYDRQVAEAQTKLQVIRQLSSVDRAYWRLYASRRAMDVSQQQFDLARALLESADRRVRAGSTAEIEVTRAQSGLADRLDDILTSQSAVRQTQRELKRIANLPGLDIDTKAAVVPATPPDPVQYILDPAALTAAAWAERMEMLELELRLLADAVNIDVSKDGLLPRLTVDATYRVNGLGGSFGDSYDELADNRFEDWSVGANLTVPIGNEAAEARYRRAVLSRLQRLGTLASRRQTIAQEVHDAADRIESGWQRILASRQAAILSARSLQAEQRQFDVGTSTSTNVLDAATRLAEAQLAEIRAVVDYQVAQIDLAEATGTLLGASKVSWEPRDPTNEPAPPESRPIAPEPAPAGANP
ncbi:MAG: TolC family protein [Phycisphaerales bacterium]